MEDTNPFSLTGQLSDTTQVEKFEISEMEYAKLSGIPISPSPPPILVIHSHSRNETDMVLAYKQLHKVSCFAAPPYHLPLTLQQFKPPLRFHSTPSAKLSHRKKACINVEMCVLWVLPSLGRVFGWVLSMMSLWGRMMGHECFFLQG